MLKKIDSAVLWIENWILTITGVAVCLLIFVSALMRYILKTDFYGSEELILFTAFWLYFIGSAVAAKKNTHINADMIGMFVHNEKVVEVFHIIKDIISLVMSVVATVWCYNYVVWSITMGAASNVFKLPVVIGQFPILISFFLWTIYLIRDVIVGFKSLKRQERGN